MGGIGKTTLALAAGSAALADGTFTGAVFLNLRGYDEAPSAAEQVLDSALRQLGVDLAHVPADVDHRAALYRAQLAARARHGERVLVVADNASAGDQVQYLLLGDGPHRLLVTSRDDLSHIGARLIDLDTLDLDQSVDLLRVAVGIPLPGDTRIDDDPDGARHVARLCCCLPLALRISAALLVSDRSLTPTELAQDLADPAGRLDLLDDGTRALRSVLEHSVRRLSPAAAELFRLLAVNPGPDLSLDAVVALSGIEKVGVVRARLSALTRAGLLRQDPASGRWSMHDLVHAYATEQAGLHPATRDEALRRLLEHYTLTARDEAYHVSPDSDRIYMGGLGRARQWFESEHANLLAAVHSALSAGHFDIAIHLPPVLTVYFRYRRFLYDAVAVARVALDAAVAVGDRVAEHVARTNLGGVLQELGCYEEAIDTHQLAIDICSDIEDLGGAAAALTGLGSILEQVGRYEEAVDTYQLAMDVFNDNDDFHRKAIAQAHLGYAFQELGRYKEAHDAYSSSSFTFGFCSDDHRRAIALNNLGITLRELHLRGEVLAPYRDPNDYYPTASRSENPELDAAVDAGERAVALFEELKDDTLLGEALGELAQTLVVAGRPDHDVQEMREAAAAAYRRVGAEDEAGRVQQPRGDVQR
ncbi:tetratricopeptide repeat protein [Kitasatospora sp. NPDC101235]|uniref:tetratricopeptide repeat protein n=1 Tax=Kitasatospora sp. NPDC101235 TaxID=3364101 RepID=UPI003802F3B9